MTDIDTTAEDLEPVEHHDQPAASVALAPRERRSEVIRPLNAEALVESFKDYQELLPRLLTDSDYQDAGRGKRFVKKSGWRKIATAFDLDVQLIRSVVERDDHGQPARAEVWARAIAPSGRAMDGDGYCSVDEDRFSGPRGNKSKLENDLRATATTRAMNRAISGLVGMGEVSAEEIDGSPGQAAALAEASPELKGTVRNVLAFLLDGNEAAVRSALEALSKQYDAHLPAIAGQAIVLVGSAVKRYREQGPPTSGESDVPNDFPPPDPPAPDGAQLDLGGGS
jgi:hypothetical protein